MTFKSLPKEVSEKIKEFHCPTIHPTAQLIKQLVFVRDEEGLQFEDGYPSLLVYGPINRRYLLTDYTEPDSYIDDSNRDSGFIYGQVRSRIIAVYDDFTYTAAGILDRPLS